MFTTIVLKTKLKYFKTCIRILFRFLENASGVHKVCYLWAKNRRDRIRK